MKEVSASILSKEDKFKNIEILNNSNTDYIHLDVMDGKFVDNKFITPKELKNVLSKINKKIDIHLMVKDPTEYLKAMALYNVSYVTIHYEIKNYEVYLNKIKELGFKVGIAINPSTDVEKIYDLLDKINLVLIMSVEPGYSGQSFIKATATKIDNLKQEIKTRNLLTKISVDGGVNEESLQYIENADIVVSSSYVLNDLNNIDKIKAT